MVATKDLQKIYKLFSKRLDFVSALQVTPSFRDSSNANRRPSAMVSASKTCHAESLAFARIEGSWNIWNQHQTSSWFNLLANQLCLQLSMFGPLSTLQSKQASKFGVSRGAVKAMQSLAWAHHDHDISEKEIESFCVFLIIGHTVESRAKSCQLL